MKARTRIAVVVLVIAALPSSLVNWSSYVANREQLAQRSDGLLVDNAEALSTILSVTTARWVAGVRGDARLPGLGELLEDERERDPVRVSRYFAAVTSRDAVNINAVGLLDLTGHVVMDSRALNLGRDESAEPYFVRAIETGQPQLFGPYTPRGQTRAGIFLTAIVRDDEDRPRGVLRLRLEPSALQQPMSRTLRASPGLSASVIDRSGLLLAGVGDLGERPLVAPEAGKAVAMALAGEPAERVASAAIVGTPWHVVIRQPLAAWETPQKRAGRDWWIQTAVLLALLLGASILLGRRIAAPLAEFSKVAGRMAEGDFSPVATWPGAEEARHLSTALDRLATRLRETIGSLSTELTQRREAEDALRQSQQDYLTLVEQLPGAVYRCGNAPGWPMTYLSPQIEALTGYSAEALLDAGGLGFGHLIVEEDDERNKGTVNAALAAGRPFELHYRIRHRDGRLRRVWELGSGRMDAEGRCDLLTGVLFDVTERETAAQAMALLRGGIDASVGGDYFVALASALARVLKVDTVMIGRTLGSPPTHVRTLAMTDSSSHNVKLEFALPGTPAERVLAEGRLEVTDQAGERFPGDADLLRLGYRSYIGRRLNDRHGRPIGILVVLDAKPLQEPATTALMLDLFQARTAAEIERLMAEEDLQRLAETLENRVSERTKELEAANTSLSQAMDQLVQREKLASLGSLVAGVAHELNTPIGNALTVSTALHDIHRQFAQELKDGQVKRSSLDRFVQENSEATALIERNLERAATLITHFKQVAVDQASVRRRRFDLADVVADVLSTLSPRLKRLPHQVTVNVPSGLSLESYPGPLEQVLTNLIENSLVHAFTADQAGQIRLGAEAHDEGIRLRYEDDGRGIPPDLRLRVFDPFFTTKLGQGGSGLGLYLVYNLVHGRLGGNIQLVDGDGSGACFVIDLPRAAPTATEDSLE